MKRLMIVILLFFIAALSLTGVYLKKDVPRNTGVQKNDHFHRQLVSHRELSAPSRISDLPDRIDGKDRFTVAANISSRWKQANTVIIVNYNAFADALAATPLAYRLNAPILLSYPNYLTKETKAELQLLKAKKVVIVGGKGSISNQVVAEIKKMGINNLSRIDGKNRFLVAANIANHLGVKDTVVFANGLLFSDALTIAPYAAVHSYPILLTENNKLPPETKKEMSISNIKKSIVIGGEGSINRNIFNLLPSPVRIGGKDRYEVASNVAATFGQNRKKVFLATGRTFADALTGSILAAKEKGIILLTYADRLPVQEVGIIKQKNVPETIIGGTGSVKDEIVQTLTSITPTNRQVLYIVPHQDDEVLSFGIDILNEMSKGRQVQLILLTRGEDSPARNILNGKVYCRIHHRYHNPIKEKYKFNPLTPIEFADARTNEYYRASEALGVPPGNIHTEFIPPGQYYGMTVRAVIQKYLKAYPNADVRTFSWFDQHPAHALLGRTVRGMQTNGLLERYQAKYIVSINTDRFYKVRKPMDTTINKIQNPIDFEKLKNAINQYKLFDPQKGYYAIGYHSVQVQFDALWKSPYSRIHY